MRQILQLFEELVYGASLAVKADIFAKRERREQQVQLPFHHLLSAVILVMYLLDLVLNAILFVSHCIALLLKQCAQLLVQVGQALGLLRIFLYLCILPVALLSGIG